MRFFDKASLNLKLGNTAKRRNEIFMKHMGTVHPFFAVIPMYLGQFYQGVTDDPNTSETLYALAQAPEQIIDSIDRYLVFWFFWSMDRLAGHDLMSQDNARNGLRIIWSFDDSQLNELTEIFDALKPGEQQLFLWKLITQLLGNETLSPLFVFPHLRNAQAIVISPEFLNQFIGNIE